jgi:superfamily II DNA or RNA helicase
MVDQRTENTETASHNIPTAMSKERISSPAISKVRFPFRLTKDQLDAVDEWITNGYNGSIIYSTGTGKTEIAFECARRAAIDLPGTSFSILFLVPRVVLVEQNIQRLLKYGVPEEHVGAYFGERKEPREITISTYQSAINNDHLICNSDMIVFDEVHLVSNTAIGLSKIFDTVKECDKSKKYLLGLTATIDEQDSRYKTILSLMPPVKKYMIKEAVRDKRLAKPVVVPVKVHLTCDEKKMYDEYSRKIRNISAYLKTSDPKSISSFLTNRGRSAALARAWFVNVKERKNLMSYAQNKLAAATEVITRKHPSERIMIFSETIKSIQRLQEMLHSKGIASEIISAKLKSGERLKILSEWGREFFVLLSVHTLEIGYDVPEVRVAVILASTSNMNQIVQRIGRIIRNSEGKENALIYNVYLSDTQDVSTLKRVKRAANTDTEDLSTAKRLNTGGIRKPQLNRNLDEYIF